MVEKNRIEIAMSLIAPYYMDPSLCGYNKESQICSYYSDGKSCVVGSCMIESQRYSNCSESVERVLKIHSEDILKPEFRNLFSIIEWQNLQIMHDLLAKYGVSGFKTKTFRSELFTEEDLIAYIEKK